MLPPGPPFRCRGQRPSIRHRVAVAAATLPRPMARAFTRVPFFIGGQDHRHGFGMDRLDDRVRCRRQEAVDQVRAGDRLGLGATVAFELRPDAGKSCQRPIVIQGDP